uniref:Uncharacterized protein n=1 Tax=Arundo donax TaxID=35708 RepID=A0A0A9BMP2_ARUDO
MDKFYRAFTSNSVAHELPLASTCSYMWFNDVLVFVSNLIVAI